MIYLAAVLQWLHILFAIAWFGSSIFVTFVVVPTARRLSDSASREYFGALGPATQRFFPMVGGLTVLLGILRGLVLGITPASAYGVTFIVALVLGVAMAGYGARVTGPNVERLAMVPAGTERTAALDRTVLIGYVELGGFAILLALMIAMRFGY